MFKMRHQYGCIFSSNHIQLLMHKKCFEFNSIAMEVQRESFNKKSLTFELTLEEHDRGWYLEGRVRTFQVEAATYGPEAWKSKVCPLKIWKWLL